jgi:hypothetical protein
MSQSTHGDRYCGRCGAPARLTASFCGQCSAELRPLAGAPRAPRGLSVTRFLVPVIVGAIVLGGAGVGAYAKLRPGSPAAIVQPEPTSRIPTNEPALAPTETPISVPTPTTYPTPSVAPSSLESNAVLSVVQDHWNAIRDHRFVEAYAHLGPGLATDSQSVWVSNHQRDGISDVQYDFLVRDVSGDAATVDIRTLRTWAQSAQDGGNPSGCLSWTGSYVLVRPAGRWLINQAHLTSAPC